MSPSSRSRFLQLEEDPEGAFLPADQACRSSLQSRKHSASVCRCRCSLDAWLSSMAAFNIPINCLCTAIFFLPLIRVNLCKLSPQLSSGAQSRPFYYWCYQTWKRSSTLQFVQISVRLCTFQKHPVFQHKLLIRHALARPFLSGTIKGAPRSRPQQTLNIPWLGWKSATTKRSDFQTF